MKKFNISMLLLAAVFAFTACEQDVKREPSPAFDGTKAVFFPVDAESAEVEPTAAFEHEILIARDTNNNEAVTVKLIVVENTQNIFKVPETVTFEAGVTETSFLVKFPNAQIDSTYTLSIKLESNQSNPYRIYNPTYTYTINIAKWDLVTNKTAIVFDGLVNAFYSTGNPGWYVNYARKDNADGSFDIRLLNPYTVLPEYKDGDYDSPIADEFGLYGGFPYNYPSDVDSEGTYNMTIHVAKNGKCTFDDFDMGMAWSYGEFSARYYDATIPGVWSKADQSITFPAGSSACFMADYGGRLNSEPIVIYLDDAIWKDINSLITVDGLEGGFNDASLTWNDIPGELSTLVSSIQPGLIETKLQNCVDPNPEDKQGPGSDFYNLYRLPDLYAPGYGLAFYLDTVKSKISLPVRKQPTGLTFAGKKLFVTPAASTESFVEETQMQGKTMVLFHFFLQLSTEDGGNIGEFEEVFYFSQDKIVWGENAEDFAGSYVLTGYDPFENDVVAIKPQNIKMVYENEKLYILGITYADTVWVDFDNDTKHISIAPQELGMLYDVYDMTLLTFTPEWEVGATAPMEFEMQFGGIVSMTETSPAMGYLLNSVAAGGFVSGAYDLLLTPSAPASAPAHAPAVKARKNIVAHKTTAEKKANFTINGKVPAHNFFFKQK